jgi:hypothetical protein
VIVTILYNVIPYYLLYPFSFEEKEEMENADDSAFVEIFDVWIYLFI